MARPIAGWACTIARGALWHQFCQFRKAFAGDPQPTEALLAFCGAPLILVCGLDPISDFADPGGSIRAQMCAATDGPAKRHSAGFSYEAGMPFALSRFSGHTCPDERDQPIWKHASSHIELPNALHMCCGRGGGASAAQQASSTGRARAAPRSAAASHHVRVMWRLSRCRIDRDDGRVVIVAGNIPDANAEAFT